jgi:hypothetical protein
VDNNYSCRIPRQRPAITIPSEVWRTPALASILYRWETHPGPGRSTMEGKEIVRGEPDPSVFVPPHAAP